MTLLNKLQINIFSPKFCCPLETRLIFVNCQFRISVNNYHNSGFFEDFFHFHQANAERVPLIRLSSSSFHFNIHSSFSFSILWYSLCIFSEPTYQHFLYLLGVYWWNYQQAAWLFPWRFSRRYSACQSVWAQDRPSHWPECWNS